MRKFITKHFFILLVLLLGSTPLFSTDLYTPIPVDPNIRMGQLDNGLKYFIKKNGKPEGRVELRLAVKAGSVDENDEQQGLAHFTEHMAFNGTQHFQKNELVNYLQSVGVKFGAHLNAYTGFDETVYMLHLPVKPDSIINKGLLVLEDWAHGMLFDSIEIEKERGVVIEEWRIGQGAEQRMLDQYLPVIFKGSKYAQRQPIGKKEVLENFSKSTIKKFYSDWYRPDLMAIVIVGDIEPLEYEAKIKTIFSVIEKKSNPQPKVNYPIPFHSETLISISTDEEATQNEFVLYYKKPSHFDSTKADYRLYLKKQLFAYMINSRFNELTRVPNPPFVNAFSYYGNIGVKTCDAYITGATVSDTGIITGLKSVLTENEKISRYGFTAPELNRAKKQILSNYEKQFNERDKNESANHASELVRAFIDNEPIPGIEWEFEFAKEQIPGIELEELNQLAKSWISDSNRVLVVTTPEKPGMKKPSEQELLSIVNNANNLNVTPYTEESIDTSLIKSKPKIGKVKKVKYFKATNITQWTLSNGAEVFLKPTNFKDDEILFAAFSHGGQYMYEMNDFYSANYANSIIKESGIGKFDKTSLQKMLSGKNLSLSPYINTVNEGFNGYSSLKDFETLLQLYYLYNTSPRFDSIAFKAFVSRGKALVKNLTSEPTYYYQEKLAMVLNNYHPRTYVIPRETDFDSINPERVPLIFKERFSNASDFKIILVGNFDLTKIKPLVEQWIGSLPSNNKQEKARDLGIRPPTDTLKVNVYKGADPKSRVTLVYNKVVEYNAMDDYYLNSLADILDIKLIESLREEKSGVYTLGVQGLMNKYPYSYARFQIVFPCAPNNVDSLVVITINELENIKQKGVDSLVLLKVKETQRRELETNEKTNNYWLSAIQKSLYIGSPLEQIVESASEIENLKSDNLKEVANKYLNGAYIQVVLYPENRQ